MKQTRAQRADELHKRVINGPSFDLTFAGLDIPGLDLTPAQRKGLEAYIRQSYRTWSSTWVEPALADLLPEVNDIPTSVFGKRRWDTVAGQKGRDVQILDVDGTGRYMVRRPYPGSLDFAAYLNGNIMSHAMRGSMRDVKAAVERGLGDAQEEAQ